MKTRLQTLTDTYFGSLQNLTVEEKADLLALQHRELTRIEPVVAAAKRWADGTGSFETTRALVEAIKAAGEGKSDG